MMEMGYGIALLNFLGTLGSPILQPHETSSKRLPFPRTEMMKNQIDSRPNAGSEPDAEQLFRAYEALDTDPVQAVSALTSLAERGSPMSMLYLGYAFSNGTGVSPDPQRAETWFRRAAGAGLLRAHYNLGRLYLDNRQYSNAKQEFEHAASNGFMPAVHFLGRIQYFGLGVPVDKVQGRILLETASRWGCLYAKATLAYDQIHEGTGAPAIFKGILMRLECYFDLVRILWTEGIASDRFR
jgi:TPR repeat protein